MADEPPPTLVAKLEKNFKDSDGDLKEVAKALVTAEEAWMPQRTKLKRPSEWIISALRLTGAPWVVGRVMSGQALLGERLWRPPAPNGFADDESAWIDGLSQRVDATRAFLRSCCVVPSTGSRQWPRLEIRIGFRCAAIMR